MEVFIGVALLVVGGGLGFRAGYQMGCEYTAALWSERMTRIDPPPRTPGQPTNVEGPPARVTTQRLRNGRKWLP